MQSKETPLNLSIHHLLTFCLRASSRYNCSWFWMVRCLSWCSNSMVWVCTVDCFVIRRFYSTSKSAITFSRSQIDLWRKLRALFWCVISDLSWFSLSLSSSLLAYLALTLAYSSRISASQSSCNFYLSSSSWTSWLLSISIFFFWAANTSSWFRFNRKLSISVSHLSQTR